ncbi:extracellular solute-binding protein [Yinghuangia sp. ASG 101]|uniref:ABC transporter substrate-binding protein n=1 Tax=Yinghuangia sp. ASG 101 TaxID=2896848 RepID=UPI001E2A98A3|nr:extracellular solute-binding protein [Yinghuangia sp. ASG 101]UGQ14086.1 extracellular solute-binding protein [Yinghuangia sp. ASG 101]
MTRIVGRSGGRGVRRAVGALAAASLLALGLGACGDDGDDAAPSGDQSAAGPRLPSLSGTTVSVAGVWTGDEQASFKKVLTDFEKRTGAKTEFIPTGDSAATFLGQRVDGKAPPDVAFLAQPGALKQFAEKGWIKPVTPDVQAAVEANFAPQWEKLASYDNKLYGVYYKGANKSLVWYNTRIFEDAGATEPATWADLQKTAALVSDSGTPPFAAGGADGWVLTDWFENIYLSQAGPDMYDKLARHEVPWTDPSVTTALEALAQVWSKGDWFPGGTEGVLQTEFPASVPQVFGESPKAGMLPGGDFIGTNIIKDTKAEVGKDAKFFAFPAVAPGKPPVVTGGDVAVAMKDSPGAMALLAYLASPEAAKVWAEQGGYISPNKNLDVVAYHDDVTRQIAEKLIAAGDDFRFDLSDQAPSAFGGTKGEGMWRDLQDFLRNPSDVAGAQAKLEADAAKAFSGA